MSPDISKIDLTNDLVRVTNATTKTRVDRNKLAVIYKGVWWNFRSKVRNRSVCNKEIVDRNFYNPYSPQRNTVSVTPFQATATLEWTRTCHMLWARSYKSFLQVEPESQVPLMTSKISKFWMVTQRRSKTSQHILTCQLRTTGTKRYLRQWSEIWLTLLEILHSCQSRVCSKK